MANWEHVAKAMDGFAAWNAWRLENPALRPDLSGANLCWAGLEGFNLSHTRLDSALLYRARLKDTELIEADLRFAMLVGADLRGAKLARANFVAADVREANLEGAEMHQVDLAPVLTVAVEKMKPDGNDVARLKTGVAAWNTWRGENPKYAPDLRGADLHGADLAGMNLAGVNLTRADLGGAKLGGAKLMEAMLGQANLAGSDSHGADFSSAKMGFANLSGANLRGANLWDAKLDSANLSRAHGEHAKFTTAAMTAANLHAAEMAGASLVRANLDGACLSAAKLVGGHLDFSSLVRADLRGANLAGCSVYGTSAWDTNMEGAIQSNLLLTSLDESQLRVDDLEMAQFVHLLMSRSKLRSMITTMTDKAVLILGRFTEREALLERIADKLRSLGYLPMIFDFERPTDRDLTETVRTLAGLSRFVIADITNPRSVPMEIQAIITDFMVPFATILERGQPAFAMFDDLPRKYTWVLPLLEYRDADSLMDAFEGKLVGPALEKGDEVRRMKAAGPVRRSAED